MKDFLSSTEQVSRESRARQLADEVVRKLDEQRKRLGTRGKPSDDDVSRAMHGLVGDDPSNNAIRQNVFREVMRTYATRGAQRRSVGGRRHIPEDFFDDARENEKRHPPDAYGADDDT